MVVVKSPREISRMRDAGRIVAEVLAVLREKVCQGVTTLELNRLAEVEAAKRKAITAFKGYSGYPYSLCCSVNDQVVHGMPGTRPLSDGDILSIDFGVLYNDFYGDAAVTLPVGKVTVVAQRLMTVTEDSLTRAIECMTTSHRLSDVSNAVQSYVEMNGFSVVRDFVGHGIGRSLHESPQVPNFGQPGKGLRLKPGIVLAIEPMINELGPEVKVLEDGWTAVTTDGGLSAHFEHTVAVTENGPIVLTTL